jgi:hypothetical protein
VHERWLAERGAKQFGEPLEHGDEPGAAGFEAEADGRPLGEAAVAEVDQVQADAGLAAAPPIGKQPAPTAARSTELQVSATSARPQTARGRLRAVSDGEPGDPPATALERQQIAHWRMVGRYKDETISALAGLLVGERLLDLLSHAQVRTLAHALEFAVRGRVVQPTLAGAITRLSKREDREQAAAELQRWLRRKADEAGPRPAQAA